MASVPALRREIVEACHRMHERGYVASVEGNVTARADDDVLVVTPSGRSKDTLVEGDLLVCDLEGNLLKGAGQPSSELPLHLAAYCQRSDVGAVIHAHPPTATGFAVAGLSLQCCALPEAVVLLGDVPVAPYAIPGTPELAQVVGVYASGHNAFLLANHGAVTMGASVMEAYQRMEVLERLAHILVTARQLGHVNLLSDEQLQQLRKVAGARNSGQRRRR